MVFLTKAAGEEEEAAASDVNGEQRKDTDRMMMNLDIDVEEVKSFTIFHTASAAAAAVYDFQPTKALVFVWGFYC